MKNIRVIMRRSDGFGKKGWVGTLSNDNTRYGNGSGSTVRVKWDIGKSYLHDINDLKFMDDGKILDPNLAFSMRKVRK